MAFRDNIAKPRQNPTVTTEDYNGVVAERSSQERQVSKSSKARTVSTAPKESFNVGNLVRVQGNTKGSGQVGNPLNTYRKFTLGADENPDGKRNRGGSPSQPKAKKAK